MILITAALSASVVVLGVALLLLWKLLTGVHDRREFAHFQRELEQRRWDRVRALPPPRKTKPFFIRQPDADAAQQMSEFVLVTLLRGHF